MVQQRHGGGDRILAVGAIHRAGVGVLTDAARVAEALAAADAADDGGRQAAGDERRALLDVQLEVGPDAGRIQQAAAFPDRPGIKTLLTRGSLPVSGRCRTAAIDRQAGSSSPKAPALPR